jgi:hypothetical protein
MRADTYLSRLNCNLQVCLGNRGVTNRNDLNPRRNIILFGTHWLARDDESLYESLVNQDVHLVLQDIIRLEDMQRYPLPQVVCSEMAMQRFSVPHLVQPHVIFK